jgi:molybdate-binding protein
MQHCSGDTLVVRRDVVDAPPIAELIECLQQRACHLAQRFEDVQLAA